MVDHKSRVLNGFRLFLNFFMQWHALCVCCSCLVTIEFIKEEITMSETIREQVLKARAAFDAIADYTQEQVDKLVYEVGRII